MRRLVTTHPVFFATLALAKSRARGLIGHTNLAAPSGTLGYWLQRGWPAGTSHASAQRLSNHMQALLLAASGSSGYTSHPQSMSTPIASTTRPGCMPWRINCLYICRHLPLSLCQILIHLTSRSATATARLPEHLTSLRLAYASAIHQPVQSRQTWPNPCLISTVRSA